MQEFKDEEVFMNKVMFLTNVAMPIVACAFVMLFINGNAKDLIVLIMPVVAVATKLLEGRLGGTQSMSTLP